MKAIVSTFIIHCLVLVLKRNNKKVLEKSINIFLALTMTARVVIFENAFILNAPSCAILPVYQSPFNPRLNRLSIYCVNKRACKMMDDNEEKGNGKKFFEPRSVSCLRVLLVPPLKQMYVHRCRKHYRFFSEDAEIFM